MRIKADWVVTRTQGTRGVAQRIKDGSGWEWGEKNLAGLISPSRLRRRWRTSSSVSRVVE